MFVIYEKNEMKFPIKVWLENKEQMEDTCLEQAMNLANLPFIHKWVSLMPDTHAGMGMPIGGVIATDGVIIPLLKNTETANGRLIQPVIGDLLRNIPVGFAHHKKKQECKALDKAIDNSDTLKPRRGSLT